MLEELNEPEENRFPAEIIHHKETKKIKLIWMRREGWRFQEPFFIQTVSKHFEKEKNKTSELDLLLKHFADPTGLDPAGFIFHLSRCGSTAVSQMLARDPENLMLSEPGAAEAVLNLPVPTAKKLAYFIGAIKAFSSCRVAPEKKIFIKFSGSDVWLPWMQMAYPKTPWIFVYRRPAEVLKSNLNKPPPWVKKIKEEDRKATLIKRQELQMSAILAHANQAAMLINYEEIDATFPARLLRSFNIPTNHKLLSSMQESLQWYSKGQGVRWTDWQEKNNRENYRARSATDRAAEDAELPSKVMDLYHQLEAQRKARLEL